MAEPRVIDMPKLVRVAVPVILDRDFSYSLPEGCGELRPGTRVWVPFGHRVLVGVVRPGEARVPKGVTVRPLLGLLDTITRPSLPDDVVALCEWMQDYYLSPPGEVYRLALPGMMTTADARQLFATPAGIERQEREALGPLLAGQAVAAGAELDADEAALLKEVVEAGASGIAISRLVAGRGRRRSRSSCLASLETAGLLESRWKDDGSTERSEAHFRRARGSDTASLGEAEISAKIGRSKQRRAVLDWLDSQPDERWTPISELRSPFPRAREHLRRLVESGLVESCELKVSRDSFDTGAIERTTPPPPTPEQAEAVADLRAQLEAQTYKSVLLHGVTGSGKTEVYLQVIASALDAGKTAIVLVPEIALTPQLADRFRARFGAQVSVLHSGLTPRQRLDAWESLRSGDCPIAIGPRSAVFAPVPNLGVIVVDEEHDGSFKQEEGVRYHARDVALVRAAKSGALAILGSATPSLESWKLAEDGRHQRITMKNRATGQALPPVELVDLNVHRPDEDSMLSARLRTAMLDTVADGGQVMLFLNRRGYSAVLRCKSCGAMPQCPDCSSASMTHHRGRNRLVCHLCGHIEDVPTQCPSCGSDKLQHLSAGTERIEHGLNAALEGLRVLRLDRDTGRGRRLLEVLDAFRARTADVLVGTQMLSKGHDFPGVTLVGVLQGDQGLEFPDPRAAERVFQLLTQVAGRAGRAERAGRVLVQTWSPEQHPVPFAAGHDYMGFVDHETQARRDFLNPPFGHLAMVRVSGKDAGRTRARCEHLGKGLRSAMGSLSSGLDPAVSILGPIASPIERINQRTRWQILLRARERGPLRQLLRRLRPALGLDGQGDAATLAIADVDPFSFD